MLRVLALALLGSAVFSGCSVKLDVNVGAEEDVEALEGDWSGTCAFSQFDLHVDITGLSAVDEDELSGAAAADLELTDSDGTVYDDSYTGTVDTLVAGTDFTMTFDVRNADGLDGSFTIEGDTSADPITAVCLSGGQTASIDLLQD